MSASTMIAAAARNGGSKVRTAIVGKRSLVSTTNAVKKSAVGVVVQATNMPLSSSVLSSFTTTPPSTTNSSTRQMESQQQPTHNNLSVLAAATAAVPPTTADGGGGAATTTTNNLSDDVLLDIDMVELKRWSSMAPTPLRLGDMYKYAASTDTEQRIRNAQFLHRELPIRLAQRAYDLLSLPFGLSTESIPIRQVASHYVKYIQQFRQFPIPRTPEEEDQFTELLHGMVLDRTSIPTTIAQGLMEWLDDDQLRRGEIDLSRQQEMEDALVRFFTARVGLRFLAEHHILSSRKTQFVTKMREEQAANMSPPAPKDRGCIQYDCNPVMECEKVAQEVARQTYDCYGICPNIEIVDRQSPQAQAFTYVPHHLHYMLAELIKNSCRASVERFLEEGGPTNSAAVMTPVKVVIVKGAAEVTIKVSDEGGGIPRSTMARIFKFTHSTSRQETEGNTDFGTVEAGIRHMRGFGLPLARIYARYFGGELTLKSMEGYGLDAYLYLPRLGDACENLPPRVSSSPGGKVSLPSSRKSSSSSSDKNKKKSGGTTIRTYTTMVPKEIKLATEAKLFEEELLRCQSTDGEIDQPGWEEAKIRRVLDILQRRAL